MALSEVPVIDFGPYLSKRDKKVALAIGRACAEYGFFCVENHGVDLTLQTELAALSEAFFTLPLAEKMKISMELGGRSWRGYFPVGGELTSGFADLKEGLYFGRELGVDDPRVKTQTPLHGPNLFPELMRFRQVVLAYLDAMTELGHLLMETVSLSLGLEANYFRSHFTSDPTILFRIFHYPPASTENEQRFPWGVGEHTDYGVLTILAQDERGGLEVKAKSGWVAIPPRENTFVCNVGDMLDFMTRGKYLSAPHRVKNVSGKSRYSFPFFFDPSFDAEMKPLPIARDSAVANARWDQQNLYAFDGTYGDYLLKKIAKVFPDLAQSKL